MKRGTWPSGPALALIGIERARRRAGTPGTPAPTASVDVPVLVGRYSAWGTWTSRPPADDRGRVASDH